MNIPVIEVYGMTETASVHTIAYIDRPIRLGSVGHPVPYSRVRVVKLDADGRYLRDCASNEIGVVAMAGPGVFSGSLSEAHNKGAFVGVRAGSTPVTWGGSMKTATCGSPVAPRTR